MTLEEVLNYRTAHRENRMKAAQWVLDHPEHFEELLGYTFKHNEKVALKASWALEFVFLEKPELLYPHLDLFFSEIGQATHQSVIRPLAHISEILCIKYYKKKDPYLKGSFSQTHKQQLIGCCFDWLIGNHKVACKCRAMTCLYYLGSEQDWIYPELTHILNERIHRGTAGYKNRALKILEQLN